MRLRNLTPSDLTARATHIEPMLPSASDDDGKIIQMVRKKIDLGWSMREPYARLWMYCAAFLRRGDWNEWDGMTRSALSSRIPSEDGLPDFITDARAVDNHLPIFYQSYITEFRQGMPALRVEPPGSNELAKLKAELANRILEVRTEPEHGDETNFRMTAVRHVLLFGEILGRVQWSPKLNKGQGDVLVEPVDVFGHLKDPYSIGKWPPRYLIEMDARHVDEIHALYGKWVAPEGNLVSRMQYYDVLATTVSKDSWGAQVRPAMDGAAIVYRFFIPSCEAYPEGMCFHIVGNEILRRHPLQLGIWPFARVSWETSILNLYDIGLIERLLQDQVKRNILTSVGFDTALVKARGDFIQIGPDQMPKVDVYNKRTNAKRILVSPNTKIQPRDTGMSFQDAAFQLNIVSDNMQEKAGRPRASLGQPLDKERTLGAQLLSHQVAATDVHERVEDFGVQFLIPIAKRVLRLYAEYAKTPREVDMGPGAGSFKFTGKDLKDIGKMRVDVPPNMSPATKRSMLIAAKVQGLTPPFQSAREEATARQLLLALGLDDAERYIAEQSVPLEQVLERAREEQALTYDAFMAQQEMIIAQAKMQITLMENPAAMMGQPPPAGGPVQPTQPQQPPTQQPSVMPEMGTPPPTGGLMQQERQRLGNPARVAVGQAA